MVSGNRVQAMKRAARPMQAERGGHDADAGAAQQGDHRVGDDRLERPAARGTSRRRTAGACRPPAVTSSRARQASLASEHVVAAARGSPGAPGRSSAAPIGLGHGPVPRGRRTARVLGDADGSRCSRRARPTRRGAPCPRSTLHDRHRSRSAGGAGRVDTQVVAGRLGRRRAISAPCPSRCEHVEHGPEAGAAGGLDHGQVLDQRLDVDVARPEARVGAVGGDQPDQVVARRVAVTMLAAADTASSRDSASWVARRTSSSTVVPALPRLLVLADHQLVVAGGRRPVDAAQVVADHVGAQGVEVVAGAARARAAAGAGHAGRCRS